jgi:putative nucleotidyltransferase with HDIG domain
VETSSEPIRATVSIGVAGYPRDGVDTNELIHQADLAVYRAKLQGRNRVLDASSDPLELPEQRQALLVAVPENGDHVSPLPPAVEALPERERRHPRPHALHGPRFLSLSRSLAAFVGSSASWGSPPAFSAPSWPQRRLDGLAAIIALVGAGQRSRSRSTTDRSPSARSAPSPERPCSARVPPLRLAITTTAVEGARGATPSTTWPSTSARSRWPSLAAAAVFTAGFSGDVGRLVYVASGFAAGATYFAVNMGLLSGAVAIEGHQRWLAVFRERFAWLATHYLVYGFIAGVIWVGHDTAGLWALAVFALPLLLMRKTQEAYLRHTQRSAQKLRQAAETIQTQNVSPRAREQTPPRASTAAMESLSATVDARDKYTAGHSRRVQQLALAIGRELGLSQAELDLLGHAALFHDIGKLAIPDAILLKPASLTAEEWELMQRHADEGARIIDRLGFLGDAVPAIRHHHERFDGTGYPDRLRHEEIPLGARIIHVADALDSMLTTRIYRAARPASEAPGRAQTGFWDPVLPSVRRGPGADPAPRGDRRRSRPPAHRSRVLRVASKHL